jgi:hypothetical protein
VEECVISDNDNQRGLGLIGSLADGIGPRPPTTGAEAMAAALIADELEELGLLPVIEEFPSARSFGPSYLVIFRAGVEGLGGSAPLPADFGSARWIRGHPGSARVEVCTESPRPLAHQEQPERLGFDRTVRRA